MERIKKALEKAREQRQASSAVSGRQDGLLAEKDIEPINYTQTRVVKINKQALLDNHVIVENSSKEFTDSIKILRTQIMQRMQENNWNTLGITSSGVGEGKTLTAINLGLSIAMDVGFTVLLVDANLLEPGVHKTLGFTPTCGLSDYLVDDMPLNEVLVKPDCLGEFVVLPGGKPLKNSSEMIGSPRMNALVEELKTRYPKRVIIFDLPPMLSTADTMAFIPSVDATLLVVEDGVTNAKDLKSAVEALSTTNIIGTVLNKS